MNVCPQVQELKGYLMTLRCVALATPKIPQQVFHESVTNRYGSQILRKDEKFFLEAAFSEPELSSQLNIVETLKGVWRGLDDSNKEIIWKYLQLLIGISNKMNAAAGI